MATWDEIKKNRQASVKVNEPVSTWDEIKYQRGWKPEEDPVYKAVKPALKYALWALEKQDEAINLYDKYVPETDPGRVLYDVAMESKSPTVGKSVFDKTYDIEAIMAKKPGERTPDEDAIAQAIEIGDHEKLLQNIGSQEPAFPGPLDVSKVYYDPEKVNPVEASLDQFFQGGPEQFFAGIYGGISAAEEFLVNTAKGLFGGEKDHVSGARQDALDFQQAYQERLEKNTAGLSPLERGAVGLSQAAGNMLFGAGMTGAAGLPAHFSNATKVAISAGAGGESYITALQKGANIDQAAAYGLLAGATEYIAESLFGGNPLTDKVGTGLVSRLVKKLGGSSKLLGFLASKPVDMLSEGIEEIISEVLNPVWEYLTFNKNPEWASLEQVLEAGINGVVLSGVLQGGSAAIGKIANLATGSQTKMPTIELDPKQMSIVEKILKGEEISGNQAEIIAKSPEAIELLRQVTGQEINTDAPISALKKEIKALANEQAAIPGVTPTVDTPTQRSAQRAAETPVTAYGKAGQKAINELYLQNQSREQYQADMSRFYQAGASGMQVEPYTGILTEPQRRGAYIAGQADAETSLAEEKYNAQFATVYKDDAGLIRNDYTPKLTKEETSFINTLFKAAGVKGEFAAPTGDKGANGWLDGGIVKIAQDAADPVMVVAKHEITHRMQEIAPEEYRQYRDYAITAIGEDAVENKRTFYESRGINLTYEQAMDEVAADFTEALLTDKSKIERLVSENRTLAQRFFDAVKEFVAKVKAAFKGKTAQDSAALNKYGVTIEQLENATEIWENALKSTAETVRMSEGRGLKNLPPKDSVSYSLKDSEGNALTPEQVEFFKDSKVRDEGGNLLVVYHGTNRGDFNTFSLGEKKFNTDDPQVGFFFTDSIQTAKEYAAAYEPSRRIHAPKVKSIYLNLKNPLIIDNKGGTFHVVYKGRPVKTDNLAVIANKDGYDGVIIKNIRDSVYSPRVTTTLIAFSPEQIKSIDNKNPTTDPDIRYSLKDSEDHQLTEAQVEFFKDSKVRDKGGNLLVVYHGTDREFTEFRVGSAQGWGRGIYSTDSKAGAEAYGKNTVSAYVNIVNPFDGQFTKAFENTKAYAEYSKKYGMSDAYDLYSEYGDFAGEAIRELGYDGIIAKDSNDITGLEIVAFSPEQIKSIDNKNPTGDPDIRYSLKDSEDHQLTEAQVEFFKDSKVRDENGNLMVVYHGTNAEFTKFTVGDVGYHLGTKEQAERRIHNSGKLMSIYANIRNPLEIEADYGDWGGNHLANMFLDNDYFEDPQVSERLEEILLIDRAAKGKSASQRKDIAMRELLQSMGYDGIRYDNQFEGNGYSYIAFSPEQIKSVDNKNPTSDPDIHHSLKGSKEYEQEIKEQKERARKAERRVDRLEELNQRLKEQMKVTKLAKTDRKALESLAREIIREYDIKMNAKDLVADLDEIYTFMANGKDSDGNDLTWEALKEKAVNLGRRLVRNASVLSNELQDDYRDMVRYFKGTRVKVSERNGKPQYKYEGGVKLKLPDHFKSDMNDFNYFRKKHMGKFTLSNDGTPIDMVYAELCDVFPGYFNEDRHMTQPDQLQHIADVMDGIRPVYENPFAGQMKEAAEIMANDIIEQFYELPQQAPTFADKQARKYTERVVKDTKKLQAKNERIAELIEDGRKRVKDILRRETERRESAITKLKEHYQAKDAKTRDLQQRRELRNKIKRQINTLSQMLLRPSDTKHIPEALRKPVSEFLASIDLSTDRMGDNTLRRLDKLKSTYQKILDGTSDVQAEIDPDIIAKIEELSDALETKKLSELSRDELQNLWEITKGMRKTVTDYNKLFAQNIRETVSEMGTAAINEQGTKAYTESALRIKQSLANLVNMDMLDSFSFFEQLGPAMQRLFQNIRDGLDIKITHTKEAADYMIKLLRDTKIDEWTGSKAKAKTFVTSVGKISLTPSQVMSLYLLNRQPDAQNHMYAGGIKAAPVVTRAGKNRLPKITKSFETLKITPNDIDNIINSLSAEQKRIAEGISKFFTDYTAKWGNEVSMTLYSYEKFMVEKYFPIVSDRNYISQVYGEVTDKTLKNMGSTKARIEGANNPIIVEDAFDVFTRQADAMASYHAFVVPLTDIQRVWNFKTLDGSVKQTIEKRYGQRVLSYFSRLITDINGGARVEAGSEFVNTLIGRYKASRVGMNLRVVVQQPTSIIRASVMIDPKYLAKGATKKGNWNTVLKYAPIAQWKDWGYFNLYTGKQLKDIFLNKHRASDTFMLAAGKADQLAWQAMWNACEYEVQDTHPSLTKGSEEYYQAVASRFSDIIDRTQVVDSVLHRTQIMRSKDTLVKMSVAFMTEPMKTYNLFRLAAQDYMQNKTPDAKKRVVRTVIGLAATAIINSAIASLVDALRDDEDELSYWEKWLNSFADDVKWVVPEMFPYVKDITSMLRGYDIKRMDMAAIGDFFNSVKMLASDKYTPVAKAANIIAKSADLFGIPASAIKREISTVINNVEGVFESELFEYYMETIMYDIDSTNNRSRYYDLVYRAWQKEDKYEFNKIVADLLKHGYTKDTIENAIQSRAKKSKEYVQEQANVYTPVADSLKSHEFYNTLSDRYKDNADDYAKQYANAVALKSVLEPNPDAEKIDDEIEKLRREMGDDYYNPDIQAEIISMELEKGYTPQKWVLGADGTDKYYFEPAKYILYRVALQMVDESNDNNSSYSTKERKAAMNLVGLNKEEQHYLEWLNKQ